MARVIGKIIEPVSMMNEQYLENIPCQEYYKKPMRLQNNL